MKCIHRIGTAIALLLCIASVTGCVLQDATSQQSPLPSAETVEPTFLPTAEPTATPVPTEEPTPDRYSGAYAEPTAVPPLWGIKIGIDPGHQYIYDPSTEPIAPWSNEQKARVAGGARGVQSRALEYEITLSVGLLLRQMLEEAGAEVYMTRTVNDVNISNKERAEFFNEHEVDLAIRLHCDNSSNPKKNGAFMLVPTQRCTEHFEENCQAAQTIIRHYCEGTGIRQAYEEGYLTKQNQTGFNWCTRPVIAIEMGFLSNEKDDALLSDSSFHPTMARGLFEGILAYFEDRS